MDGCSENWYLLDGEFRLRESGRHFADDHFKFVFIRGNRCILFLISRIFPSRTYLIIRLHYGLLYWRIYASLGFDELCALFIMYIFLVDASNVSRDLAISWIPHDFTDVKSTLAISMARWRQQQHHMASRMLANMHGFRPQLVKSFQRQSIIATLLFRNV